MAIGELPDMVHVACGTCTACCRNHTLVTLHPESGDDPAMYDCDTIEVEGRTLYKLKHTENGDCIYLGEGGCTIHGRAPVICRTFDCAAFVREWPRARRRKYGIKKTGGVIEAGLARLKVQSP